MLSLDSAKEPCMTDGASAVEGIPDLLIYHPGGEAETYDGALQPSTYDEHTRRI